MYGSKIQEMMTQAIKGDFLEHLFYHSDILYVYDLQKHFVL